MTAKDKTLALFEETGPGKTSPSLVRKRPFSIRLQYRSSENAEPFADIELTNPSDEVVQDAAELFLHMMTELSNGVAVKD